MENLKSSAASNCSPTDRIPYSAMKDKGIDAVFLEINHGVVQDDALNSLSLNYSDYELAQMPLDPRACDRYTDLILGSIIKVLRSDDNSHKVEISCRLMNHIRKIDMDIFLNEKNRLVCITPIESRTKLRQSVMGIVKDNTLFSFLYLDGDDVNYYCSITGASQYEAPKAKKRDNHCLIQ